MCWHLILKADEYGSSFVPPATFLALQAKGNGGCSGRTCHIFPKGSWFSWCPFLASVVCILFPREDGKILVLVLLLVLRGVSP